MDPQTEDDKENTFHDDYEDLSELDKLSPLQTVSDSLSCLTLSDSTSAFASQPPAATSHPAQFDEDARSLGSTGPTPITATTTTTTTTTTTPPPPIFATFAPDAVEASIESALLQALAADVSLEPAAATTTLPSLLLHPLLHHEDEVTHHHRHRHEGPFYSLAGTALLMMTAAVKSDEAQQLLHNLLLAAKPPPTSPNQPFQSFLFSVTEMVAAMKTLAHDQQHSKVLLQAWEQTRSKDQRSSAVFSPAQEALRYLRDSMTVELFQEHVAGRGYPPFESPQDSATFEDWVAKLHNDYPRLMKFCKNMHWTRYGLNAGHHHHHRRDRRRRQHHDSSSGTTVLAASKVRSNPLGVVGGIRGRAPLAGDPNTPLYDSESSDWSSNSTTSSSDTEASEDTDQTSSEDEVQAPGK